MQESSTENLAKQALLKPNFQQFFILLTKIIDKYKQRALNSRGHLSSFFKIHQINPISNCLPTKAWNFCSPRKSEFVNVALSLISIAI